MMRSPDERIVLKIGERYKITPGTPHCISNQSASESQFLLIQGVGKYDWHKADLTKYRGRCMAHPESWGCLAHQLNGTSLRLRRRKAEGTLGEHDEVITIGWDVS